MSPRHHSAIIFNLFHIASFYHKETLRRNYSNFLFCFFRILCYKKWRRTSVPVSLSMPFHKYFLLNTRAQWNFSNFFFPADSFSFFPILFKYCKKLLHAKEERQTYQNFSWAIPKVAFGLTKKWLQCYSLPEAFPYFRKKPNHFHPQEESQN